METTSRVQPNRIHEGNSVKKLEYLFKLGIAVSAVAGIGAYLSWTSIGLHYFKKFNVIETDNEESWVGSLLPLGAILGSLPVGILADKYGRKFVTWYSAIPLIIGWFIICFVQERAALYAARFFAGIGCGAASIVAPMYFYELANTYVQRHIVQFVQWCLNFGIVWPYAINISIGSPANAMIIPFEEPKILLTGFLSFYSMTIIFLLPESPMWLEDCGRREEAERAIKKLTGTYVTLDRSEPVKVIGNSGLRLSAFKTISNKADVILILALITLQQFSGIGPLTFFWKKSMYLIQYNEMSPWVYYFVIVVPVLIAGISNCLHQCMGEKFLLIISTCLMAVSSFFLTGFAHLLQSEQQFRDGVLSQMIASISMTVYLTAFHIGLGPIPWIMIGKMFPTNSRKMMYNLAVTYSWMLLFITTKTFMNIVHTIGMDVMMLVYVLVNLLGTSVAACCVPRRVRKVQEDILENLDEIHTSIAP